MNSLITLLESTNESDDECAVVVVDEKTVASLVIDLSQPLSVLIQAINLYFQLFGNEIAELLNRLISMYSITLSSLMKKYIMCICMRADIPFDLRLEMAKDLCFSTQSDDAFNVLEYMCTLFETTDISTTLKVEALLVLVRNENCVETVRSEFIKIITSKTESKFRYNLITSLKSGFERWKSSLRLNGIAYDDDKLDDLLKSFQITLFTVFLKTIENNVTFRILAGQWLLVNDQKSFAIQAEIESISTNVLVDYNMRADAADVLLKYGSEEFNQSAKAIIEKLGQEGNVGGVKTIYQNAQNAHMQSIEASAMEILIKLSMYPLMKMEDGTSITFEYVKKNLFDVFSITAGDPSLRERASLRDTLDSVLTRIELDHALYTHLSISLKSALMLTYSYIAIRQNAIGEQNADNSFIHRLIDELCECTNICSTGILERIVNSISGCDDFSLKISFEEQISSNLLGRLNYRIKKLSSIPCLHSKCCDCKEISCYASKRTSTKTGFKGETMQSCGECALCLGKDCVHKCDGGVPSSVGCSFNSDLTDLIFEEMLIPSNQPQKRRNFSVVYRLYISEIMEELREEFKDFIDDVSFDLYFRKAMMNYEG